MILDRIQRYLSMVFFTVLVVSQALVFVGVSASNNNDLLSVVFVEPVSQNINIGDSMYFQAMMPDEENSIDFVYFNLQNPATGLDENYQASLQADGSWKAQSVWDTDFDYYPGQYYLSVVAHDNQNGIPENIYYSQTQLINLNGDFEIAADDSLAYFSQPTQNQFFNLNNPDHFSLTARFHLSTDMSAVVSEMRFSLVLSNTQEHFDFYGPAHNIGSDGQGFDMWESNISIENLPEGDYTIVASANEGSTALPLEIEPIFFEIGRTALAEPIPMDIPLDIEVLSPTDEQVYSLQDDILIQARSLMDFSSIYSVVAHIEHTEEGPMMTVPLAVHPDNPLMYSAVIDLDDYGINDEGGDIDLNEVFFNGEYTILFYLYSRDDPNADNIAVGRQTFFIELDSPPTYRIILNSPLPDSTVEGDSFILDFETTFSAEAFSFSLVKENNTTVAIEDIIPLVSGGILWQYNVTAPDNFENGNYILTSSAVNQEGDIVEMDTIVFEWIIDEEEDPLEPEDVSLYVYPTDSNRFAPGDLLVASANVLDINFLLSGLGDSDTAYELDHNSTDCTNEVILNQEIRDQVATLGHDYCFYSPISGSIADEIVNGNYNFYIQYIGEDFSTTSDPVLLTYFNEANQDSEIPILPEDIRLSIHVRDFSDSENFAFVVASNWDTEPHFIYDLGIGPFVILENTDSDLEPIYQELKRLEDIEDDELQFINSIIENFNNPEIPYIFAAPNVDLSILPEGEYLVHAGYADHPTLGSVKSENNVTITISSEAGDDEEQNENQDDEDQQDQDEDEDENNEQNENDSSDDNYQGSYPSQNEIAIDFYSTCVEQGILDEETCMRFRATMDLLDPTCIEQGIYEDLACEDYLFRIETDMECQSNDIIDREECKNFLLEKYGGQVDCQLNDINLCNSILRNEYLNRLVAGQRLSNSINEAVDSLLGQNISTQELSDNLIEQGVDSQEVLPLSPNQETKVLVAKAQKETVLEEEDKLTILNQAVIILDHDGDGLSDDLEDYYGTDIFSADTDGDGYDDGTEIRNGYDPLGPGKLTTERTDFDKVILEGQVIEQPKIKSKKIDRKMEVESVDAQEEKLKLSGKAEASTWVNLYLYSGLPLVMTTKTDASGNWSYDVRNSLTDGHHRVFVTVNDDTGKIVKQSRPISFLIKEAQAVTADDYFDEASSVSAVNNLFIYYILGGAFLVFLALGVIVYMHKGKDQDVEL